MFPRFLIDGNLTPDWVDFLQASGYAAVHWSAIGRTDATDHEIMVWALANRHVVFTADLDFTDILFASGAAGPSVLQLRCQYQIPAAVGPPAVAAIRQFEAELVGRGARDRGPGPFPRPGAADHPLTRFPESSRLPPLSTRDGR